ncbi:MAG: potassium-transporting ATPase subunit C [Ignavibacteriae bacterium]|nr:potassium-transporting ATPase subunit C [Ignavibacteriota bacterium]
MKIFLISAKFLLLMTLITGLFYPFFIFGIAKIAFPNKSGGSFIEIGGVKISSELIAQKFDSSIYFQPRPSAISYLPMPSGGSNLAPTSLKLRNKSDSLKKAFIRRNLLSENTAIPPDAVFSSGSGIDPHISPENALLQAERIASARGFGLDKKNKLLELINILTEQKQFGLFGEPRINVLILNIELDKL